MPFFMWGEKMEDRIALVGIIIHGPESIWDVNDILHVYGHLVKGRMGLPKVDEGVAIISVVVKAPQPEIAAMTGKLGSLPGVNCKAIYAKQ